MLVLKRKTGQQLLIGDSIVVTVVRISPQEVRIGIDVSPEVDIVRHELLEASERPCEPALPR